MIVVLPLIIFVGASATGKTTLCRIFTEATHNKCAVSTTTRPRRPSDKDGDYIFIQREDFRPDNFVEYVEYNHNYYGVTKAEVDASGFAIVELNGAVALRSYCHSTGRQCYIIGLTASSEERLKRMRERNDSAEAADERVRVDNEAFPEGRMREVCDYIIDGATLLQSVVRVFTIVLDVYHCKE